MKENKLHEILNNKMNLKDALLALNFSNENINKIEAYLSPEQQDPMLGHTTTATSWIMVKHMAYSKLDYDKTKIFNIAKLSYSDECVNDPGDIGFKGNDIFVFFKNGLFIMIKRIVFKIMKK